jgi:hypothetical protein
MLNILTDYARDVRKPNRRKRKPQLFTRPDIFIHPNGTVSAAYMPNAQADGVARALCQSDDPKVYSVGYPMARSLGYSDAQIQAWRTT